MFVFVADGFQTQEICQQLVKKDPSMFPLVQEPFQMQEMCQQGVKKDAELKYVADWFVTVQMVEKCQDEEWLRSYKQRKAQKAKIKEELLPVAWHPDCVIDWCFDEEEKKAL